MNNFIQKTKEEMRKFLKDPLFLRRWEWEHYPHRRNDNQLSVRIGGYRRRKPYPFKGDSFMFVEDMYTGIMPFMLYRGEGEKYPTRVEPRSPEKEGVIADGISGRGHRTSLADALCDFVRKTAHVLFQDGVAFYEIIYKKNEVGEVEGFDLELMEPFYLFKSFGNYYQVIPWWEAKESHVRVRIIKIPKGKILRIDFPKQFGGRKKINQILKRLYCLSKELIPEFYMKAMEENKNIGFNFNEFNKWKYLEIAKLTNKFGWNQRQRSDNYITEYYSMVRFLRGKKLEAVTREQIISKLNEALNGSLLNLGVRVVIENLFTVGDVERQGEALKGGDVAFMDIFNSLKI